MTNKLKSEKVKRLKSWCALFLTYLLLDLSTGALHAQAPRPPTSYLSQLSDVNVSSPIDDQPLVWDAATSKWGNSNTLDDMILQSTTVSPAGTVANFSSAKLQHPSTGDIIDWSGGSLKVLRPLLDTTNLIAENVSNRQLIGVDGTTVKVDWSGTGLKFPTLTNSNTTAFLQTDASGNVSIATIPGAGAVATTSNILTGDGSGNAISTSPALTMSASGLSATGTNNGAFVLDLTNTTAGASTTIATFMHSADGLAYLMLTGSSYTGGVGTDTLLINNTIPNKNIFAITTGGVVGFSNDGGTTLRTIIGTGLMVGTTTDPGTGILNVLNGYQVNGTALANLWANASAAGATGFAANQAIPGSVITIPAGAWKVGGAYHCVFDMTKTAAGTAGIVITVHMGVLGTISDVATGTITFPAGTAAVDTGIFDVYVTFKSVGSGTTAVIASYSRVLKTGSTTGLINNGLILAVGNSTSAGFNSTTQTKISLGFNGGTSFAGTNFFTQTEYKQ
jgi:hypothetical protein